MSKYLCREGNIFLFRRRVPERLQKRIGRQEIYRSLKTSELKLARQRSAALFLASERLFAMADDDCLSDEDICAAARHWLSQTYWQKTFATHVDSTLPGDLRREGGDLPKRLLELGTDEEFGITPLWARRYAAHEALQSAGYLPQFDNSMLDRTADVLLNLITQRVENRIQTVFQPQDMATTTTTPPVAAIPPTEEATRAHIQQTPRVSDHVEEWQGALVAGWKNVALVSRHTARQYGVARGPIGS